MSDLPADAEKSKSAKIALRSRLLTARRRLPASALRAAAAQLQEQICDLVRRTAPSTIAAYVPVGAEPGGADLPAVLAAAQATALAAAQATALAAAQATALAAALTAALTAEARVILPVLLPDGDLDWAAYEGTLDAGPRGLREPSGPRLGVDAVRSAGLVLVPALAVDTHGRRMGRGGGSYDRALSRLRPSSPTPLIVALLHDGELVDEVPTEPHDRPVHGVITPTGGFVLNRTVEWTK